jgi:2-polyprenyl-6-methoxyphenol hydroxylase-like FAD-dependent oxidoreductase
VESTRAPAVGEHGTRHHALVIGGSLAGLFAGRVLADHFARVTIVDRDQFPEQPDHRKGVPQSHHAHALLPRGRLILEEFFPGLSDDLRAAGALSANDVVPIVVVGPAGRLLAKPFPGEFMAFSRFLLEWHVREHLKRRPEVQMVSNCEVTELLASPDRSRVTGVRLNYRGEERGPQTVDADLVVDASGRNSRAPDWLRALGYDAPPEEAITSGLGYASRFYRKPDRFPAEWLGLIVNGRPPNNARAGIILPIEHNGWHVTLGGIAGNYPPTDEAGFMQWARDLIDPSIYEAIRVAEPLSPIRGYRTPKNRVRHYERLERRPRGFAVTGDAVCSLNPLYGQGMTVAALDALALNACLRQGHKGSRVSFEQRFQQAVARATSGPWLIATGEDLRWPGVALSGARPRRALNLIHRYMDLVLLQGREDLAVAVAYRDVTGLLAAPESLLRPSIFSRVLWGAAKRAVRNGGADAHGAFALSREALASLRAREAFQVASMPQDEVIDSLSD